jgi:CheY-like chemotaxis protein
LNPKEKVILVVEDEPGLAFIFSEILQGEGFVTHVASNGKEALKIVENIMPKLDLVLCDLSMPIMDGLEFFKAGMKKFGRLPVVMLTAHSDNETISECMRIGAIDYVIKPFDLDILRSKLPEWIKKGRAKPAG